MVFEKMGETMIRPGIYGRRLFTILLIIGVWLAAQAAAADTGEEKDIRYAQLPVFAIDAEEGFKTLIDSMAGKRVYLLGDASHGTEEFYAFRKRVTRHLITRYKVRALVLEAEWDSAEKVDLYIRGKLGPQVSARTMLAAAFFRWPQWVWANEELVEFVQWLKLYNSSLAETDQVRCYGMDMQLAVDASLAYLSPLWPTDSKPGRAYSRLSSWWQPYVEDPLLYNKAYAAGTETGSLLANELLGVVDTGDLEARDRIEMLISAEEYYRTMSYNNYEAWNIRSRYFARYVQQLERSSVGRNGVIAWAHNSHVGDMSSTEVEDTGLINFGRLMREALGRQNVFILGSAGYTGTVLAAVDWGQPVMEMDVPPAVEGSFEEFVNAGGWSNPLLLWRNEEERRQWSWPMLHRGIGVQYNPVDEVSVNYLTSAMGMRYDAVVFWQKTHALQRMTAP